MTHGWHGFVIKLLKLVGPLTPYRSLQRQPADDHVHLVLPSLPSYSLSDGQVEVGCGPEQNGADLGRG